MPKFKRGSIPAIIRYKDGKRLWDFTGRKVFKTDDMQLARHMLELGAELVEGVIEEVLKPAQNEEIEADLGFTRADFRTKAQIAKFALETYDAEMEIQAEDSVDEVFERLQAIAQGQ